MPQEIPLPYHKRFPSTRALSTPYHKKFHSPARLSVYQSEPTTRTVSRHSYYKRLRPPERAYDPYRNPVPCYYLQKIASTRANLPQANTLLLPTENLIRQSEPQPQHKRLHCPTTLDLVHQSGPTTRPDLIYQSGLDPLP